MWTVSRTAAGAKTTKGALSSSDSANAGSPTALPFGTFQTTERAVRTHCKHQEHARDSKVVCSHLNSRHKSAIHGSLNKLTLLSPQITAPISYFMYSHCNFLRTLFFSRLKLLCGRVIIRFEPFRSERT